MSSPPQPLQIINVTDLCVLLFVSKQKFQYHQKSTKNYQRKNTKNTTLNTYQMEENINLMANKKWANSDSACKTGFLTF